METINTIGRRKAAIARVYLKDGDGKVTVNGREFKEYFPTVPLQHTVVSPFLVANVQGKFDVIVNLNGGGIKGQAEAIRLGISRAIQEFDKELRKPLKQAGFLTRDPRVVERKKPGRSKARKKFQFSKR